MSTNLSPFSTSNAFFAVSATRQTTVAAISIGLPSRSFTLIVGVLRFWARSVFFAQRVNHGAQ